MIKDFLFSPLIAYNTPEVIKEIQEFNLDEMNSYEKAVFNLKFIDPTKFKNYNNAENSLLTYDVCVERLPVLVKKLKEYNSFISSDLKIYSGLIPSTTIRVKCCEFFLSEDHYYIDEVHWIYNLIKESSKYLELINSIETTEGINNYNKRCLSYFTNNLIDLLHQLRNIF